MRTSWPGWDVGFVLQKKERGLATKGQCGSFFETEILRLFGDFGVFSEANIFGVGAAGATEDGITGLGIA